jgi:hypothetical protein
MQLIASHPQDIASLHQQFVMQQAALHQQFLELRQNALLGLMAARNAGPASAPQAPAPSQPWSPAPVPAAMPALASVSAAASAPTSGSEAPALAPAPAAPPAPRAPTPTPTPTPAPALTPTASKAAAPAALPSGATTVAGRPPTGPIFDRAALEVHAGGRISEIFGPLFEQQDRHDVQVRMPEPPLLLADRVVGIDAEPGSMQKGTVWTETDVREDSWWLNQGYMPAGIMIESGQADLFLISYLGVDFHNRGERAYRLLGCELTYHGSLPKPGETLRYEIDVDGHANQGDVRLFFFHYDCVLTDAEGHTRPSSTAAPCRAHSAE